MNCHAADYENDERNVDPANYPSPDRAGVSGSTLRYQCGRQVDLAPRKIRTSADMTLPARLRQIVCADHRLGIGRGQDVVNAVTARTIRNYLRPHSRRKAMLTIAITTDTFTCDSEFSRQRHTFMALGATLCSYRGRGGRRCALDGRLDVVNAVAVSTYR